MPLIFYCENLPFSLKLSGNSFFFLEGKFVFYKKRTSKFWLSVTSLLFSLKFSLFRFLWKWKTSKQVKMTSYIDSWILIVENMTVFYKGLQTIRYHCTQEHWIYFSLFLNPLCFILSISYFARTQGIVLKMFLNVLINIILIKKHACVKISIIAPLKNFSVMVGMKSSIGSFI